MTSLPAPARALLAGAALLLATACADHDRTPGPAVPGAGLATVRTDVLLRVTPSPDLRAFSAELSAVELLDPDGAAGPNLLAAPLDLELEHLADAAAWLARERVAPVEHAAVRVRFVPGSYRALAEDGTPVLVTALSDELVAELPAPVDLGGASYARLVVHLDLRQSLSGVVADGALDFEPEGLALASDGAQPIAVDEVVGLVTDRDTGTQRLELEAFADQRLAVPVGAVDVLVPDGALAVTGANFVIALVPYFLTFLSPGASLVEVDGELSASGSVRATRVEIEDQLPPLGQSWPVQLSGRVVRVLDGFRFEIELLFVERGADLLEPLLASLGDPSSLVVRVEPFVTVVFRGDEVVPATAVRVGQHVELALPGLPGSVLRPGRVEIEREPAFPGVVTDVTGLPDSLRMRLAPSAFAVRAGLVASSDTVVEVWLDAASIALGTPTFPALAATELSEGLELEVRGAPVGPPTAPVVDAAAVRVAPGRLRGATVAAVGAESLDTTDGEIAAPFGGELVVGPAGPLRALVDDDTLFRGAAGSLAELADLLDALEPDETLAVDVAGIATDVAEVRALDVRTTLVTP